MSLKIENANLSFGSKQVLFDVSFDVADGEFLCMLGPSGCGKTTTLRIAAGLEAPETGTVTINGEVVSNGRDVLAPEHRNVGFLFQDYALFPHLNVADNVAFGLRGKTGIAIDKRVSEVLQQVRMSDYANHHPHELSGGQQQRIALARALAPKPSVILLDEPFSGLDAALRAEVRDETLHVLKSSGVSAMMVTHDPEEAMFMGDKIVLMKDGRVVQVGSPVDLYCQPVDRFAASFFGEVNVLQGRVEHGRVKTPLGEVRTTDLADGQAVDILIRPEGIKLVRLGGDVSPLQQQAKVSAARFLGRTSLVHMTLCDEFETCWHVHARIAGRYLPKDGETLFATLDPDQTYIFPRSE